MRRADFRDEHKRSASNGASRKKQIAREEALTPEQRAEREKQAENLAKAVRVKKPKKPPKTDMPIAEERGIDSGNKGSRRSAGQRAKEEYPW